MSAGIKKNRRWFLENAAKLAAGSYVLESFSGLPLISNWTSNYVVHPLFNKLNAYELLPDFIQGGASILKVADAYANTSGQDENVSIVHIRVVNHVAHNLVFRFGNEKTTNTQINPSNRISKEANAFYQNAGVDRLSGDRHFGEKYKFNAWFADMLRAGHFGVVNRNATTGSVESLKDVNGNTTTRDTLGIDPKYFADYDESKVALQVFQHLKMESGSANHNLKNFRVRNGLPDINQIVENEKLIQSPLGISCFMMGENYDSATGSSTVNGILAGQDEVLEFPSQTVDAFAKQITQSVGKSYVDRRLDKNTNLTYQLDKIAQKNPKLREEILATMEQVQSSIDGFKYAAEVEKQNQVLNRVYGNVQSSKTDVEGVGASKEFLAQCLYVANAVSIPSLRGSPLNNFNLFLNMIDLDRKDFDTGKNALSGPSAKLEVKAYSYIEGMRQLALGLNILAKSIADGHKVIVIVSSEGGRDVIDTADSNVSFGMVMGPKMDGWLDDFHYVNHQIMNADNPNATNHNFAKASWAVKYDEVPTGMGLRDHEDKALDASVSAGDMLMGVIEFLEEKRNRKIRDKFTNAQARFIKLKRHTKA